MFAEDIEPNERSPIDFTIPLASSPPIRNRDFREPGESSRGAQENNQIMEMLISIHKSMEEREKKWSLQQKFREEVYEAELKRRYQQWEKELNRKEEVYEAELKRKEQQWEEEMNRREEQIKKILEHQEEKFKKEMEERDQDLLKKLHLSHESFYNNQYDRDSQLLKLIKERDSEQEAKRKEQIKGFKFLYMSMFKDFEKKMKKEIKIWMTRMPIEENSGWKIWT